MRNVRHPSAISGPAEHRILIAQLVHEGGTLVFYASRFTVCLPPIHGSAKRLLDFAYGLRHLESHFQMIYASFNLSCDIKSALLEDLQHSIIFNKHFSRKAE